MAFAGPRIITVDGVSYTYDRVRGKLLSTSRMYMRAGAAGRTVTNQYLRAEDGQPLMSVGDAMPRNATIVGITANTESSATWTVEVYKRGSVTLLASLPLVAISSWQVINLNADIASGDILLIKAVGANIPMPRSIIEIAWRL